MTSPPVEHASVAADDRAPRDRPPGTLRRPSSAGSRLRLRTALFFATVLAPAGGAALLLLLVSVGGRSLLAIVGALALIGGAALSYHLTCRRVLAPIATLLRAAVRLARGQQAEEIAVRQFDELGELAAAFNAISRVHREALEDLLRERDFSENVVRSIGEMLIVLNPDRTIRSVNPAGLSQLGYKLAEIVDRQFESLLAPGTRSDDIQPLLSHDRARGNTLECSPTGSAETELLTRDLERIPVALSYSPMRDRDGRLQGYVCIASDLTDRLRHERQLLLAKEAAEAGTRAKSEFMANLSREIRTPIHGILGMTSLMLEADLPREQRESARAARDCADALLNVVSNVLDVSSLESGSLRVERVPFDLRELVERTVAMLRFKAWRKNLDLKIDIRPGTPHFVITDPGRLQQVLVNLIGNGISFTDRGHVAVVVRLDETDKDEPSIRFVVEDTGRGMPDVVRRSLLDASYSLSDSLKPLSSNGGLGLIISRELVTIMGGVLGIEDRRGSGSRLVFTIPARPASRHEIPTPTGGYAETTGSPADAATNSQRIHPLDKRILVVEDNRVNQAVAVRLLEKLGCVVDVATNGREAVEKVQYQGYDLVLMDCQMPVMDGYQAAALIREWERTSGAERVPIIAMTANALEHDKDRCLACGMDDYLRKPVKPEALREAVVSWSTGKVPELA